MDMELKPEPLRVERPPQSGQDRPRRQGSDGDAPSPRRQHGEPPGSSQAAGGIRPPFSQPDSVSISTAARVVAETDYAASHPPLSFPRLLLITLLRRK